LYTTSLPSELLIGTKTIKNTDSKDREYQIQKAVEKFPDGIGFNKLRDELEIPRKTLHKYLQKLEKDESIKIEKLGNNKNSELCITINLSSEKKENLEEILNKFYKDYHWSNFKQKTRKSNVFPHFLQILSAQYYWYLTEYFFQSPYSYRYGIKQLEEKLELEKTKLEKEFTEKQLERLWEDCEHVDSSLLFDSIDSVHDASRRKKPQTHDEITMDRTHPAHFFPNLETDYSYDNWAEFRFQQIKDPKKKKEFIKLMDEHNQVISELSRIKSTMSRIVGIYPFEKIKEK